MRRRPGNWLRPIEIVRILGPYFGLGRAHFGAENAARPEKATNARAGVSVVVDPLGDQIAGALQRGLDRGHHQFFSHAACGRDEASRLSRRIDGWLLAQNELGEWLEAALSGHRGPRAAFGS